jgi:hypothetical protein
MSVGDILEKFRLAFIGTISLIVAYLVSLPFKELLEDSINNAILETGGSTASALELLKIVTDMWFEGVIGLIIAIILLVINVFVGQNGE